MSKLNIPGRNDTCTCGSGKKYKKCCEGKASQADEPDGRLMLAQNHASRQDFAQAEQLFRQLLGSRQQADLVLAGLGQCLCRLNRSKEGVPYLRQAGKLLLAKARKNGQGDELFALIHQLIHWQALAEALELAKAVLLIAPASPHAHHLAALALQGLNRHAEALRHAERVVSLVPADSNAQILLAVLEAKAGQSSAARQRLEPIVCREADPNLARAHLELGVILDKCGEFDQAFSQLRKAGERALASAAARQLDKTAVFREIAQLKAGFDAQFLRSRRQQLADDGLPAPVFLIGFYRSGSTLAEQILAAHPQVSSSDETHLLGHVLAELSRIMPEPSTLAERIKALNAAQIGHLRGHYWAAARQALGDRIMQRTLVDKTTLNTLNIELINVLFPEAQVIYTVRDPRDICLSCIMQSFVLSPLTVHLLCWQDCARFYAAVSDYWLSVRDALSLSWTELRYEEVVADLEGQFRPVFAKLGLEWSDECLAFYRHSQRRQVKTPSFDQVTRPLYATSAGRWRNYQQHYPAILPLLEPFIRLYRY